jgi:hypothetical protein
MLARLAQLIANIYREAAGRMDGIAGELRRLTIDAALHLDDDD